MFNKAKQVSDNSSIDHRDILKKWKNFTSDNELDNKHFPSGMTILASGVIIVAYFDNSKHTNYQTLDEALVAISIFIKKFEEELGK
jgi:hypothetical protein